MNEQSRPAALLIGYGEVGRAFGAKISAHGWSVTYVDPFALEETGDAVVLSALPLELAQDTLVLGLMPSAAAEGVARDLARVGGAFLYLDLSSSPKALMEVCADAFTEDRARFVDGAIMGSVDLSGASAPILLSGPRAPEALAALQELGFSVSALPDSAAGDAGGIKLLRTLMTKGIEALAVECYAAATAMGLQVPIRDNLTDISARPFPDLLDAMVRSHVLHAPRRKYEVAAAIAQAESYGLKLQLTQSVLQSYERTVRQLENTAPKGPLSTDEAVALLSEQLK
ncbi:phosphogluconate dehydrogenase [Salipiger pallidus]|uniref:Phosphogluconate dehydrogenase n=1 Tax=Salipiger pallidus TaxID=1775170 RepID=A0A8J2ZN41_9RHOB|nr:hypothetical protein [Salipiger pallidus]GGG83727.1 phosphogluconate dehydrogenase [Salipiger pallidus]